MHLDFHNVVTDHEGIGEKSDVRDPFIILDLRQRAIQDWTACNAYLVIELVIEIKNRSIIEIIRRDQTVIGQ